MSDLMLHAVLNMPVEMWRKDSSIDDIQRQSRYFEASNLIYQQADKIAELEKVNDTSHKLMVSGESRGVAKATEEFKGRIAELEEDKAFLLSQRFMGNTIVSTDQGLSDAIKAHNLEQQAKGVEDFVERYCGTSIDLEHEAIRVCAKEQVQKLKGGAE
jgi:hypothetical protein